MPPDKFKTQVLLLHSEQSTLDSLTSGFNERYTVHCATSGSEALNTLVETPINVIVSAHDLPGMSGLEALREAKKRSPDTIGILLAESADDGLEALAGDKEVFQVVRGTVTGDSILKLVDDATQQVRLTALAESANDNAVDLEDPDAEHIVMETSEDGAAIISDGTGRLPVLNPNRVRAASSIGSQAVDLLVLTKDQEFLSTIKESSRGTHNVHFANTLAKADESIRKHKVGVAIVDAAMIGDKIEQLTEYLRRGSPRIVTIVGGRRGDGEMLMDLINRGKLYRFLLKPVSPGRARLAIEASVKHHLEAPDAAFKTKAGAATPKAATTPVQGDAPKADAKPGPQVPPQAKQPVTSIEPPVDDSLAVEFGGKDSSFTETVAGLIGLVGKTSSNDLVGKTSSNDEDAEKPNAEAVVSDTEPTPAAAESGGSLFQNKQMLGVGAATIVVLAVVLFWFMSRPDETVTTGEPMAGTTPIAEQDSIVEAPIADADEMSTDSPVEDDTVASADTQPDTDAVVEEALAAAETALLESRLDDAGAALDLARSVDPNNPRLPFLAVQLSQLQLRSQLNDARAAIGEKRLDDANRTLEAARLSNPASGEEIDAVEDELNAARTEQRALDLLAMANARLEDGDLLSPPKDNALYYFELALQNDAQNMAAREGLNAIASNLALEARSEIDNGNLESAQDLLGQANEIAPGSIDVAAAVSALSNRRDEIAAERRQKAEEKRRAEAEKRAAEARAEAERRAAEERAAEQTPQVVADKAAPETPADQQAAADAPATVEDPDDAAAAAAAGGIVAATADAATSNKPVADGVQPQAPAASTTAKSAVSTSPAPVSSLKRMKYVAPKYPRAAQRRNVSGWVDVVFTVAKDGTVKDIEILESEPGETFDKAATKAVERWVFEPVVEDGKIVEKFAGVRMMFALE